MIIVLGGTKDGIIIGRKLQDYGYQVMVSAKSQYGRDIIYKHGLQPYPEPLGISSGEMFNTLINNHFAVVVDATHPFSTEVTKGAITACNRANIPFIRFERPCSPTPNSNKIKRVKGFQEAASLAKGILGTKPAFLAIGSNSLNKFTEQINLDRLVVRILPVKESIAHCLSLGISPKNIVAIQGPVSYSLNKALFENYQTSLLITKDSGDEGGLGEKVKAGLDLDMDIIIVNRPSYQDIKTASDYDELVDMIRSGYYG